MATSKKSFGMSDGKKGFFLWNGTVYSLDALEHIINLNPERGINVVIYESEDMVPKFKRPKKVVCGSRDIPVEGPQYFGGEPLSTKWLQMPEEIVWCNILPYLIRRK